MSWNSPTSGRVFGELSRCDITLVIEFGVLFHGPSFYLGPANGLDNVPSVSVFQSSSACIFNNQPYKNVWQSSSQTDLVHPNRTPFSFPIIERKIHICENICTPLMDRSCAVPDDRGVHVWWAGAGVRNQSDRWRGPKANKQQGCTSFLIFWLAA